MATHHAIPDTAVSTTFHPDAYAALSTWLTSPEVTGVGAWVRDREILRRVCLEKIRRDGPDANDESGFVASFIGNLTAPWAEELVNFWYEGLGTGWNLWINGENPSVVFGSIQAGARPELIFTPFPLPARIPDYRCELHSHWAFCRYDTAAGKLTAAEQAIWDDYAQHFNIKAFEASLGEGR